MTNTTLPQTEAERTGQTIGQDESLALSGDSVALNVWLLAGWSFLGIFTLYIAAMVLFLGHL